MTENNPEPENVPAMDELPSGEDIHEQYVGEEVAPDDDPNITEHHDG